MAHCVNSISTGSGDNLYIDTYHYPRIVKVASEAERNKAYRARRCRVFRGPTLTSEIEDWVPFCG